MAESLGCLQFAEWQKVGVMYAWDNLVPGD